MNKMDIDNKHFKFGKRQSGVTTALIKETILQDGVFIALNNVQRDYLKKKYRAYNIKILSIGDIKSGKLKGVNPKTPLIIDNVTLVLKALCGHDVGCIGDTYDVYK